MGGDLGKALFALLREKTLVAQGEFFDARGGSRQLMPAELVRYSAREPIAGWRTSVSAGGRDIDVDVLFGTHLPFSAPEVFVVGEPRWLDWPHVEQDNKLCLIQPHAAFTVEPSAELTDHLLSNAQHLLEASIKGENDIDFVREFHNYWNFVADEGAPCLWSLLDPGPPSRTVFFSSLDGAVLVFEDRASGNHWTNGYLGDERERSGGFRPAAFLWLKDPLKPSMYPRTNADLMGLARIADGDGEQVLADVLSGTPNRAPVVMGFDTENGPALAGQWVVAPTSNRGPGRKRGSHLSDGFRRGTMPKSLLMRRYQSDRAAGGRTTVKRCDSTWIHSRGGARPIEEMAEKRVAVIGCGAIGCSVAHLLAQAGIGNLVLIDPEKLSWDNVGRHLLGGKRYVGLNKAAGMCQFLLSRFPHLNVRAVKNGWEGAYQDEPAILSGADAIVSTIGSWGVEAPLNMLARTDLEFPPMVFGWSEAHASAGHALVVLSVGGCFACGCDGLGRFQIPATEWPDEQLEREPACGAFYQPFGCIDLMPVQAMVADVVMDVLQSNLVRSHHRVWLGSSSRLTALRGEWNPNWCEENGDPEGGEKIFRFDWPITQTCALCR